MATSVQETSLQETESQETSLQETESHETESQDTSVHETSVQLTASNTGPSALAITNRLSARFGLAAFFGRVPARAALTWPTPQEPGAACGTARARAIIVAFTSSGVSAGKRARSWAAMPETTGVANDVPDSSM